MSVIIYQDHIDMLEEQNSVLKKEVRILRALLRKERNIRTIQAARMNLSC